MLNMETFASFFCYALFIICCFSEGPYESYIPFLVRLKLHSNITKGQLLIKLQRKWWPPRNDKKHNLEWRPPPRISCPLKFLQLSSKSLRWRLACSQEVILSKLGAVTEKNQFFESSR
uniref:Uncharacterized protein n=1 Tax=Micrurus corallinus TaxID=54390 RepID=A0A2D4G0H2_MICCO